jgi:hypothetical protein
MRGNCCGQQRERGCRAHQSGVPPPSMGRTIELMPRATYTTGARTVASPSLVCVFFQRERTTEPEVGESQWMGVMLALAVRDSVSRSRPV